MAEDLNLDDIVRGIEQFKDMPDLENQVTLKDSIIIRIYDTDWIIEKF